MIQLNFTKHPDPDFLGTWNWNKNIVSLENEIAVFEINDQVMTFYPSQKLAHYTYNGKRAQSSKKLKLGDLISFNGIEIQVTAFAFIPQNERVSYLKTKFNETRENNKGLFDLLSKIEKMF